MSNEEYNLKNHLTNIINIIMLFLIPIIKSLIILYSMLNVLILKEYDLLSKMKFSCGYVN